MHRNNLITVCHLFNWILCQKIYLVYLFIGPVSSGGIAKNDAYIQSSITDTEIGAGEGEGGTTNLLDSTKKISKEDFEFLKVVGRGSFGKVYMAKKKTNTMDVFAIKVLDKSVLVKRNLLIKTQGNLFYQKSSLNCQQNKEFEVFLCFTFIL